MTESVKPDLFRGEAVEAARDRIGLPVNNFGLKSWVVPVFMAALFATTVGFVATARYAKKETVLGEVVPATGVAKVAALRSGVIKKVWVKSGQAVVHGQPLFSISYDPVLKGGDALSDRLTNNSDLQASSAQQQNLSKRLQIQQSQLEAEAKLSGVQAAVAQYAEQKSVQVERIKLLEQTVEASRPLLEKQYISAVAMRQREDGLLQARQGLLQIDQSIAQGQSQASQLIAQITSYKQMLNEVDASARLSQAQIEEKRLINMSSEGAEIVALKDGKLTALQAREGDLVVANQTMGMIVPANAGAIQQVTLWVPSRSVGFIQVGSKVRLMFDAYPYQTYGVGNGRVTEISSAPFNPDELPVPIETKEQMYKITVALDRDRLTAYGRQWALIPGMRLSADLILDEKSLLDWLLDPLMAARRRL